MPSTRPAAAADWMGGALDGARAVVVVGGDGAVRLVAPAAAERGAAEAAVAEAVVDEDVAAVVADSKYRVGLYSI